MTNYLMVMLRLCRQYRLCAWIIYVSEVYVSLHFILNENKKKRKIKFYKFLLLFLFNFFSSFYSQLGISLFHFIWFFCYKLKRSHRIKLTWRRFCWRRWRCMMMFVEVMQFSSSDGSISSFCISFKNSRIWRHGGSGNVHYRISRKKFQIFFSNDFKNSDFST